MRGHWLLSFEQFSRIICAHYRLADINQRFGLIAVSWIRPSDIENNGIFELFTEFRADFGSEAVAAKRLQECVPAFRL